MEAFANRLQKVDRHISKWARRQGITCYRVYDMDMPEFPFCIDRYEDKLHIAEYRANHRMSDAEHDAWLEACMQTAASVLDVAPCDLYLKERRRLARRSEQYEKVAQESRTFIVAEQGLRFKVNLTDYLDTGLFLDHRPLRKTFREEAAGKKVLNLFSYTGAFSVYAAAGGAATVTTVDLSNTYLQWARENMALNELLEAERHHFIQGDVMEFLKNNDAYGPFDLVFVDPPAFSNSKKMKGTWDTQRDHPALLRYVLQQVAPGGVIYFSNNLRGFVPQLDKLGADSVKDISLQTIPEDFRNKKIHHCYRIVR